jgi:Fe-S-cluster-containing hydrogenase component 2
MDAAGRLLATAEVRRIISVKQKERERSRGFIAAEGEICSGCRTCEAVCSLVHESAVSSQLSRIEVKSWPFEGYRSEVYACQQCEDPPCLSACPTGALQRADHTNAVIIKKGECTGCQLCREACPYTPSRIRHDAHSNTCVKCDLCGGTPLCVKYCMEGALRFQKG